MQRALSQFDRVRSQANRGCAGGKNAIVVHANIRNIRTWSKQRVYGFSIMPCWLASKPCLTMRLLPGRGTLLADDPRVNDELLSWSYEYGWKGTRTVIY